MLQLKCIENLLQFFANRSIVMNFKTQVNYEKTAMAENRYFCNAGSFFFRGLWKHRVSGIEI